LLHNNVQAQNSIAITEAKSPDAGKIQGSGTYTLAKGYSVKGFYLQALKDGQVIKSMKCDYSMTNWEGITIGLAAGVYEVRGVLIANKRLIVETRFSTSIMVEVK
jgi:hypothetical protein